jgi:hypothetical protein
VQIPGTTSPSAPSATGTLSSASRYERHRPEASTLYRIVRENLNTLYAAVEDGFAGAAALPGFVRKELDGYLDCGLLWRGFAVLACEGCKERQLVAYCCKGRGFCPRCLGRRMAQSSLNLLEHVLPAVPLRQWVLTLPHELRRRLAYDGELLAGVGRVFVDSVLGFYRRRTQPDDRTGRRVRRSSGAVTVVQRTSSDLKLNPHFHAVFLDGSYAADAAGTPIFQAVPRLSTSDVADVLQIVRARILGYLKRRGVVIAGPEATAVDDDLAQREPVLAQLAAAAVSGLPPAGPESRRRPEIPLRGRPGVMIAAPLSVAEMGFSLHAATHAGSHDRRAREALVKYILRPPIAEERLHVMPDDRVRIALRRPFRDGTYAIDMDPLSLLSRLAAAVPPPRQHSIRYAGVVGAASKWRALVVPPPPTPEPTPAAPLPSPATHLPERPTHRCRYRPFVQLLRSTFAIDLETCAHCGGRMKIIALVRDPDSIARYLRYLGEPTEPPPRSPARAPPYWRAPPSRRRPSQQGDLFDA